jgi:hypothetical protein
MAESRSIYKQIVTEILTGLSKVRLDQKGWLDSESEELGRETQVFKIGECLYPFYLASDSGTTELQGLLPPDTLYEDTKLFFRHIEKHGFFPSPYSQIPEAVDQYTDFAAFMLVFSTSVCDYWQHDQRRGRQLIATAKATARRAFEFLLTQQHSLRDEAGCRWAGTSKCKRTTARGVEEYYTSTFFTANVAIAVARTLEHPLLELSPARRDEARNFVRDAGKWIVARFDGGFITGDEPKSNRALIHTTWGLRMLLETFDIQEQPVRKMLPAIANAYLSTLRAKLDQDESLVQQEYLTILSEDVSAPLYYEDRSGIGGVLITLALLPRQADLEDLLEKLGFNLAFEQVLNSVMILRNLSSGLWYSHGLILSIHTYLVEAFLMLAKRGFETGRRIEVSGHMVRTAVRETFCDDAILTNLQQTIYQRLLKLVESSRQEKAIDTGMAQWNPQPQEEKAVPDHASSDTSSKPKSSRAPRKPGRQTA